MHNTYTYKANNREPPKLKCGMIKTRGWIYLCTYNPERLFLTWFGLDRTIKGTQA